MIFIASTFSTGLLAQETPSIKVEGKSSFKAIPEIVQFNIPITAKAESYTDCVDNLMDTYNSLEKALGKAGVDKSSLKSMGFSVNENIVYNGQKRVQEGYKGSMSIGIEMTHEDKSMNKVIEILAREEFSFGFSLNFKLSSSQKAELDSLALSQAVLDAQTKAQTMAGALNMQLGSVETMEFFEGDGYRGPVLYDSMMKAEASSVSDVSLNPREIEISKSVRVAWTLNEE